MLPSPSGCRLGLRGYVLSRPPLRSLSLRPGDSLTIPWMALSMGFKYSVSLLPAIQATGFLALTLARLTLAEHASLSWTHNPAYGFPVPGFPGCFAPRVMRPIRLRALSAASGNPRAVAYSTSSAEAPTFSGQSEKRQDGSAFALAYILLLSSGRLMDAFIMASLPPLLTEELHHSRAPSLPGHYPGS